MISGFFFQFPLHKANFFQQLSIKAAFSLAGIYPIQVLFCCASCLSFWSSISAQHMPGTFPVGHFSYLLLFFFFFNFSMYTILHYHIYQFILHLPQPVLLSSASGIRLSLCSFQFTGQSLLNNIVLVLLQQQLTSVELLHEPLQHLSHGSSPPNFRGGT